MEGIVVSTMDDHMPPKEGDYHEQARAHWMRVDEGRLWAFEGKPPPMNAERWDGVRRMFDDRPLNQLPPLRVVRMIGGSYRNKYQLLDGHHRCFTARERHIPMLLVEIWRMRKDRFDRILSTSAMIFDRV